VVLKNGRYFLLGLIVTALFTAGCAHYPINPPLTQFDPEKSYQLKKRKDRSKMEDLFLILTFSGGGTRAAALAYGVLEELAKIVILREDHRSRLLDEVDLISSVSGGSFTAAYYGLYGDRIFEDFEEKFLKKNIQKKLIAQLFSPANWIRLLSPNFGRSDLTAEYYDQHLFEGNTLGDIAERGGPIILINATDMTLGSWFSFSRDHFDWICSDISLYPVSRAVSASSAVPMVLSPITLHNYAGSCGYQISPGVLETLQDPRTSRRRFEQATRVISYLDAEKRPYIHLLDGGLSDNLGLRTAMDRVILIGSAPQAMRETGLEKVQKIAFIVVNAETEPDTEWNLRKTPPTASQSLKSATSAMISRYNFETIELLKSYLKEWSDEIRQQGGPAGMSGADIMFYLVEVNFDALSDSSERAYFKSLPTSFNLPPKVVDQLRDAARKILSQSSEFKRLVDDLARE